MNKTLGYIRNWTNPDGSIRTTYYVRNAIRPGESEEEFIKRSDEALLQANPEYGSLPSTLDRVEDMPDFKHRERFRRDTNGKIFVDMKVKTEGDKREEREARLRQKKQVLKQKLLALSSDLTVEEIDILLEK